MKSFYFNGFTKVNEAVHTEKLQEQELVQLENMRLDEKVGQAETRNGFSRYNLQAAASGKIHNIFDVKDADGSNYLLANAGTALRKSLNGSAAYEDVKTGLADEKLRMAIYGDNLYFTNNEDAPFYTDLTDTYNMDIDKPDITGISATITGSAGTIVYLEYAVVFVLSDGQQSTPSNKFAVYDLLDIDALGVTFADIPVSTDPRVVSKKIYRTTATDRTTLFSVGTINNSITTFEDVASDDSLNFQDKLEYLNTPDKIKFMTTNSERLIGGNITKTTSYSILPPAYFGDLYDLYFRTEFFDDTVAGDLGIGTYQYARSLVDKEGNESELVLLFTDTVSAKEITFRIAPDGLIRYDQNIVDPNKWVFNDSIQLVRYYRTAANGTEFLHLDDIPMDQVWTHFTATAYNDNNSDASLGEAYPLGSTTNLDSVELKSSIVFSSLYSPNEFPELNLYQIYPDDNDEITGIHDDDNGIMIFKERSICKLYTVGDPTNWYVKKIVSNIGCDEPDSVYKYGSSYFFMFEKRPYLFDGQSTPRNIGETRKDTFDSVTAVNDSTFWHDGSFYIISVNIGTSYYLLAYDLKLQGWYKFTVNAADSIITKIFGSDAGKILLGGLLYVTHYDDAADYDTDSGERVDIPVALKTKDFIIDDFFNMRLMFLNVRYKKLLERITDSIVFYLTDPSDVSKIDSYNDNESLVELNTFYMPTDAMLGDLKRARVINFSFSGVSMKKFINARLDYNIETWGVERRSPGDLSGLGVSHGSSAGVSD